MNSVIVSEPGVYLARFRASRRPHLMLVMVFGIPPYLQCLGISLREPHIFRIYNPESLVWEYRLDPVSLSSRCEPLSRTFLNDLVSEE